MAWRHEAEAWACGIRYEGNIFVRLLTHLLRRLSDSLAATFHVFSFIFVCKTQTTWRSSRYFKSPLCFTFSANFSLYNVCRGFVWLARSNRPLFSCFTDEHNWLRWSNPPLHYNPPLGSVQLDKHLKKLLDNGGVWCASVIRHFNDVFKCHDAEIFLSVGFIAVVSAAVPINSWQSYDVRILSRQPWRRRKYVSPKHRHLATSPHGLRAQKSNVIRERNWSSTTNTRGRTPVQWDSNRTHLEWESDALGHIFSSADYRARNIVLLYDFILTSLDRRLRDKSPSWMFWLAFLESEFALLLKYFHTKCNIL